MEEALAIGGTQCGDNVCGTGTYCCNSSCGICAPKGGACPDVMCEDPTVRAEPKQEEPAADVSIGIGCPCGENYCGQGYFCCNASCGVCAPAGGGCPQVVCEK